MASFKIETSTGDFTYGNAQSAYWTINGNPGNNNDLLLDTWYALSFDLTAIPGFTPGTTAFDGQLSFLNRTSSASIYIGEMTVVPEPATFGMLGVSGALLLLARRIRQS